MYGETLASLIHSLIEHSVVAEGNRLTTKNTSVGFLSRLILHAKTAKKLEKLLNNFNREKAFSYSLKPRR